MQIVGGIYRNRRLKAPKTNEVRPTSSRLREALFNICQNYIEGSTFLDIFAGSGAMGLEALSRGACRATFIEQHREALKCIQANIEQLQVQKEAEILSGNAFQVLERLHKQARQFAIIYADPPYFATSKVEKTEISHGQRILEFIDSHDLLTAGGVFFLESGHGEEQPSTNLKTLSLRSTRRAGRALLQEFVKGR